MNPKPKPAPATRAQDMDRHVGKQIRRRRMTLGLTQDMLAEQCRITYQQVHKYENGANRVAAGRLHQIAQALGIQPGWFFEGFGKPIRLSPLDKGVILLVEDYIQCSPGGREALRSMARHLKQVPPEEEATVGVAGIGASEFGGL